MLTFSRSLPRLLNLARETGNPSDDSRAKLIVQGSDQSVAIYAACQFCDDIVISNIQIDGSWRELGYNGGYGLIEAGGDNSGQTVKNCKLQYPRGWTALHGIGTLHPHSLARSAAKGIMLTALFDLLSFRG